VISSNQATSSWVAVNLNPDRINAWCKTALIVVKTVISILRALKHAPFNLPGFPAQ
jgi:hypothetical protein